MSTELSDLDALQGFLEELPAKLEKSPYDYTIYSRWISLLRAIGDIESVRAAREHMYRMVAVPEGTWAEWIRDEVERPDALHDSATIRHVADLYALATKEYALVSTWEDYIAFAKRLSGSSDERTRLAAAEAFGSTDYVLPILQSAVDATEAHYTGSQSIWVQYKEYIEHAVSTAGNIGSASMEASALVDFLQAAFVERLERPHADLEATFALYSQFITQHRNDAYEQHMVEASGAVSRTRQLCMSRSECEEDFDKAAGSWDAAVAYVERLVREKTADTKEISMVYERGLAVSRYNPTAWDEYIVFLAASKGETPASLQVASRAVRNCPWSGRLWAHLVHLTYAESGLQAATVVYARAISTHAVDYSMSEFSQLAVAQITVARLQHQSDGSSEDSSDHSLALLQTCNACLDSAYALDVSTADPTLRLERCCSAVVADTLLDATAGRKMWTRICKTRRVCTDAWLLSAEFEQAHGSEASARSVYRHAAQRRLDNPERLFDAWIVFELSRGSLSDICSAERTISQQRHLIQRRAERESHTAFDATVDESIEAEPGSKRQRVSSQGQPLVEPDVQTVSVADSNSASKELTQAPRSNIVYVSNLPPSFGPHDVEKLFGGCNSVHQVAMIEARHDSVKGQAKVELSTVDALISALDKNGLKISGHFVSVHTFKPPRQPRDADKTATVEVRGFSPETGNKRIEQVARQAGVPVRVHRSRLGDVVFVVMKAQDAQQVVSALHGCSIDDRTLEACIARSEEGEPNPSVAKAATPAAQVADPGMIPRKAAAAARRPTKKVALPKTMMASTQLAPVLEMAHRAETKTNADFRQLLLDQKQAEQDASGT
ncbi:Splicing factor [Coemansia sp. BCRC 34301]|nr:Splicing factor [Coemansia sp. BCRC 34301]